jgi:IS5 family transposase
MHECIVHRPITAMSQRSASAEYALKKKRTRRERFLADMERVVPWARLIALIEPLYPSSGRVGRQPIGVSRMLRMYCLQQWYGLADEALEDALYDSQALRDFVGIDLSRESVPDATTLLKFRRLLLANELTQALFDEINAHLAEQGLLMRAGTIVDATIIAACQHRITFPQFRRSKFPHPVAIPVLSRAEVRRPPFGVGLGRV